MVPISSGKGQHRVQVPMLVDRQAEGYSCLLLQLDKGVRGQRECQSGWRGWLSLQLGQLATRRKIASRKLSSAPVPQDLKISSYPAHFPSCLPPRVYSHSCAARVRVEKHIDACGDQVNGTSVRSVLLEARNEGGGRGNPSERVRARPRGRRVVSPQRLRSCRLYAESKTGEKIARRRENQ